MAAHAEENPGARVPRFSPGLDSCARGREFSDPGAPFKPAFGLGGDFPDPSTKARRARRNALIVPREHGAWGLLLVPMITGAGVALRHHHSVWPASLLLAAALALFWLRTPLESLLGTSAMRAQSPSEKRLVLFVIAILLAVACLSLAALLWAGRNPYLWLIGVAAGAAFVTQVMLNKLGRNWRMLSEMIGTVGLSSCAAAAYYVMTGSFGATAWMLWLANFLFSGNQIHYVQLRIHTAKQQEMRAKIARGWSFVLGQLGMAAVLTLICAVGLMPWLALAAFAPILLRGWIYFLEKPERLIVRRLGWSELRQA